MNTEEKVVENLEEKSAVLEQSADGENVAMRPADNKASDYNLPTENKKSNKKQMSLIILCWISYLFAYLGRYGFSANINLIISDYGVTKSDVGLVVSLFFFAYGAGQIVNGIFSKKYNLSSIFTLFQISNF